MNEVNVAGGTSSKLLAKHLDGIEELLLKFYTGTSLLAASANMGPCREQFVRSFLEKHLSGRIGIGSGEIIDSDSTDQYQSRAQVDVVLYDRLFPELDFGALGINMFFVESVKATIEVKSTLNYEELKRTVQVAQNTKKLKGRARYLRSTQPVHKSSSLPSWSPDGPVCFLVAYNSPQIETVWSWLGRAHEEAGIADPGLPFQKRCECSALS